MYQYLCRKFYAYITTFLKKRFAFSETSCIIQTGFSSFESIQTKILEEIEGTVYTFDLLSQLIALTDRILLQFRHLTCFNP